MILRRITEQVRDQNWFAVALDFVIVVMGILIAFQITNWNEARQDNLLYQQARQRVIEEAQTNLALARDFTAQARAYRSTARDIIEDLEKCSADAGAEDRLVRALQSMKFYLGVDVLDDATNLILNSDAFLDNVSPDDRAALAAYARKLARVANNVNVDYTFQLNSIGLRDIPVLTRTSRVNWGDGMAGFELNVSYMKACANPDLGAYMFDRYQHANYELLQAERLTEASREVLIGLGERPPETSEIEMIP